MHSDDARATRPTQPRASSASAERSPAIGASLDAFRRILRALRVAARRTQMEAGVSAAQLFVLRALADGGEASISEIAARTLTDRSSVAAVIVRLVDAGLASRTTATSDRRRAAVRITPAGRRTLRRAPAAPTTLLLEGLEQLGAHDLDALARGLTVLTAAMALDETSAGMMFDE
jgi:DNA-binding MarR family transcriptional regulator